MASVIVTFTIMPESTEIDMDSLSSFVISAIKDYTKNDDVETKQEIVPVAFGLRSLKITFVMKKKNKLVKKTLPAKGETRKSIGGKSRQKNNTDRHNKRITERISKIDAKMPPGPSNSIIFKVSLIRYYPVISKDGLLRLDAG